jgi:L-iditol 2-dehydrogenase
MKAGLRDGLGKIKCIEIPKPVILPNEVLVQVKSVGICGSDINRILIETNEKWDKLVIGHEFGGIVTEIGKDVTYVKIGDKVTGAPLVPCHKCDWCKKGLFSLCKSYSFIGSRKNGAFAEYVAFPEENIIKIESDLSFDKIALIEPITVCLHPILKLHNLLNSSVLVMGTGAIGLLAVQIFKAMGAYPIIASDVVEEKLALAKKMGADITVNVAKQNLEEVTGKLPKQGVDVIFESSGSAPAKKSAIKAACGGGIILLVGTSPRDITFEAELFELITRKELHLAGSWMNYSAPWPGTEWRTALQMLESGSISDEGLISHRYPLDKISDAFKLISDNKELFVKVILNP